MRYAAIDCGTNSIRLLVCDVVDGRLVEVSRELRIVRLGEGVDQTRSFAPAALERTFQACREYRETLFELGDPPLVFAATSASRDVSNREQFQAGIRQLLGVAPQVISGEREALLSFLGATWDLPADYDSDALVFDIGGGSTELIRGDARSGRVAHAASVDLGCVRLSERHRDDAATSGVGPGAAPDIAAGLARAAQRVPLANPGTVIGLSGTVTTVAALALRIPSYDPSLVHHARIPHADIVAVVDDLAGMSLADRDALAPMHPGRADVIVAGGMILLAVLQAAGCQELLVSEADILDGLVLEAAGKRDAGLGEPGSPFGRPG